MLRRSIVATVILGAIAACTNTPSPTPLNPPADSGVVPNDDATVIDPDAGLAYYTWWQDVQPIVAAKCQLCHASPPQFGAPRSYVTYADMLAIVLSSGAPVHAEIAMRIRAPQNRMPPPNQPPLTEEEIDILVTWSLIGAPEGTPPGADAGPGPDSGVNEDAEATPDAEPPVDGGPTPDSGVNADAQPGDTGTPVLTQTIDLLAHAPGSTAPYDMPVETTNYVCWSFTLPQIGAANQQYAVRFEPLIDNTTHIHHTLLFRDRNNNTQDGPFSCDGLPTSWDMIAGWAPGRGPEDLPMGVGTRAFAGDRYVLQAHYDRVTAPGQTDQSGMRVTLTTQQGLTESGILWHGLGWLNPINGPNATHTWTCRMSRPMTIFSIFPHMHMTGTRIILELQRAGQSTWEMVAEVPAWSFEDQPNISVPMHLQQLQQGDRLRTQCWWNTMGRSINFGEASNDEMCFNFINHYPLIPNANTTCVGAAL